MSGHVSSSSPSHRASAVLPLVLQAALVVLGIVLLFVSPDELPDTYVLSAGLTLLLGWSLASWRVAGLRLFDPYCVFLISAFLFNAGHALLEVINSNEAGLMNEIFSDAINRETLALSFVGLAALHFGALLTVCVGWRRSAPLQWPSSTRETWAAPDRLDPADGGRTGVGGVAVAGAAASSRRPATRRSTTVIWRRALRRRRSC